MSEELLVDVDLGNGKIFNVKLIVLPNIGDTLFLYEPDDKENEDTELIEAKVIKIAHILQHTFITDVPHAVKIVAEEQK